MLNSQTQCVLAVPGPDLAEYSMFCGTNSGRSLDKSRFQSIKFIKGTRVGFVWLESAIANLEVEITARIDNGDHDVFLTKVLGYHVSTFERGPNLLSIGRRHRGFELLARSGVHRIGIPKGALEK